MGLKRFGIVFLIIISNLIVYGGIVFFEYSQYAERKMLEKKFEILFWMLDEVESIKSDEVEEAILVDILRDKETYHIQLEKDPEEQLTRIGHAVLYDKSKHSKACIIYQNQHGRYVLEVLRDVYLEKHNFKPET